MLASALTDATVALAAATALVAVASFWTGHIARSGIERQLSAQNRPFVYPWLESAWADHVKASPLGSIKNLPIKNGGNGPALNVTGALYWSGTAGGGISLEAGAMGESEAIFINLGTKDTGDPNLNNARGFFRYTDASGVEWQTHFEFAGTIGVLATPALTMRIIGAGRTVELGEPQYNSEAWVNASPSQELRWGARPWRGQPLARWSRVRMESLSRRARELENRARRP